MPALRITRALLQLALRTGRARFVRATILVLCGSLAAPLAVYELGRLIDRAVGGGVQDGWISAGLIAALLVAQTMMGHFAHLDYFELAELEEGQLRSELTDLVNGPARVGHLDDPAFADDVTLVRESLVGTTQSLEAVLNLAGILAQTVVTAVILANVNAWLLLMPLAAIPPVLLSRKAHAIHERAREDSAGLLRLSRHFLELATSAPSVKELRVVGGQSQVLARQATAWRQLTRTLWLSQAKGAALRTIGQLVYSLAYVAAILLVITMTASGRATIGDVILVIALATQVNVQIASALQLLALLQTAGRMVERMASLRRRAELNTPPPATGAATGDRTGPERLRTGIVLDHVSFSYTPGGPPILRDVCLEIPAGSVLALVGENGAGKSTLVKLLCGLYAPTGGRILVDGVNLSDVDPEEWHHRTATLFQDFYRFQFTLGESIGIGDVDRLTDSRAVATAVARAHAQPVVDVVPGGLAGYTGRDYDDGVELSGGQWQTVGLARCLMRTEPQLLIMDEPAAALDPEAEHALFERYGSSSRTSSVTVLISHRFSTVRRADTIAVLEHGRLTQHGTHDSLMAAGGLYSELFTMQARAYR